MMAASLLEVEHHNLIQQTFNRLLQIQRSGLLPISLDLRRIGEGAYAKLTERGKKYMQLYFDRMQQKGEKVIERAGADWMREQKPAVATSMTQHSEQWHQNDDDKNKWQQSRTRADQSDEQLKQRWRFGNLKQSVEGGRTFMQLVVRASMVQESTLLHVSRLLGLPLLFIEDEKFCENNEFPASVLLAVMGELDYGWQRLQEQEGSLADTRLQNKICWYIRDTMERIIDFLEEAGRDRLTYLKEAVSLPDVAAATDGFFQTMSGGGSRDWMDGFLSRQAQRKYLTSVYVLDQQYRGDPSLERMLHSGSLSIILHRMQTLTVGGQPHPMRHIRWAIIRQAPFMNRTRQLIFTRLAQVLCSRFLRLSLPISASLLTVGKGLEQEGEEEEGEKEEEGKDRAEERKEAEQDEAARQTRLAVCVLSALVDSGVPQWCYEEERQKEELLLCEGLPPSKARVLDSILCVRVFRGFIDLPPSADYPTENLLTDWFASWARTWDNHPYPLPNVSDSNLYRFVPIQYKPCLEAAPPPFAFRNATKSELVPDGSLSGALANTLAPICSTLFDADKYNQAMATFLAE